MNRTLIVFSGWTIFSIITHAIKLHINVYNILYYIHFPSSFSVYFLCAFIKRAGHVKCAFIKHYRLQIHITKSPTALKSSSRPNISFVNILYAYRLTRCVATFPSNPHFSKSGIRAKVETLLTLLWEKISFVFSLLTLITTHEHTMSCTTTHKYAVVPLYNIFSITKIKGKYYSRNVLFLKTHRLYKTDSRRNIKTYDN